MFGDKEMEQTETVTAEHELTVSVLEDVMHTESFLQDHELGQSETVADESVMHNESVLPSVESPFLEVVLPSVESPCLEVVLPSVESPSTQSAEVRTEEVGHGQVQKLRKNRVVEKRKSINKLCAVEPKPEPNSGKREKKSTGRKKQKK